MANGPDDSLGPLKPVFDPEAGKWRGIAYWASGRRTLFVRVGVRRLGLDRTHDWPAGKSIANSSGGCALNQPAALGALGDVRYWATSRSRGNDGEASLWNEVRTGGVKNNQFT